MMTRDEILARLRLSAHWAPAVGIVPQFRTWLDVRQVDEENWEHLGEYIFDSAVFGGRIIVPKGRLTDFASVPRAPITYMVAGGRANGPAAIHDYLYSDQFCTREVADKVFMEAMLTDGTEFGQRPLSDWLANVMYHEVSTWGWIAWDRHARGEKVRLP